MKTHGLLAVVSAAFVSVLMGVSAQAQSYLTEGLVAYYPFDGNANDESGRGNHGVCSNITFVADSSGCPANAASFAGNSTSFITIPGTELNLHPPFAVSAWVKIPQLSSGRILSTAGYELALSLGRPSMNVVQGMSNNSLQIAHALSVGEWHHVAGVWRSDGGLLYTNGVLAGTYSTTYQPDYSRGFTPKLGRNSGSLADSFSGVMDEVRVYSRELSQADVLGLFNNPTLLSRRATATVQIVNGFVVGFTVVDRGYGYSDTQPPAVRIQDTAGTGALAHAVVENGQVVRIEIDNNGRNYTGSATVRIASPPFWPSLSVYVSRVTVKMAVVLGRKYQLDISGDMQTWTPFGDPFVAEEEEITQEFPVTETQKFFRIREVQ